MNKEGQQTSQAQMTGILSVLWPLALSWFLIAAELPLIGIMLARLSEPELNLAAFGSVVYPVLIFVESPIFMLISASTALCKDENSYRQLLRFTHVISACLTLIYLLITFSDLHTLVVYRLIGASDSVGMLSKLGFVATIPVTWFVAYRRFHQGILIRFGRSRLVGVGTLMRLAVMVSILLFGYMSEFSSGVVIAGSALSVGIIVETIFVHYCARPIIRNEIRAARRTNPSLDAVSLFRYYLPLALTSLLGTLSYPLAASAMFRMPLAGESTAAWPVVAGMIFFFQSIGIAYREVVIALVEREGMVNSLKVFTFLLAFFASGCLLIVTATPLASLWIEDISALSGGLAALAQTSLWFSLPIPFIMVYQCWYQGIILQVGHTRAVTEGMVVYVLCITVLLLYGVFAQSFPGLYVYLSAASAAHLVQNIWLRRKSLPSLPSLSADRIV